MRIAVIGAGGVGGSFGAALAKAGNDVTFVARGAHLAAMRARGLAVLGPRGDIHLQPGQATDDPARIGPVDVRPVLRQAVGRGKRRRRRSGRSWARRPPSFRCRTESTPANG